MNKSIRFAFLACAAAALCAVGCENNKSDADMSSTSGDMGVVSGEKPACCAAKEAEAAKGQCADKAATCETKN